MKIQIVGIQFHYYQSRIEELRSMQPGALVLLCRETDGPTRGFAIRAMLRNRLLGYVKSLQINKINDIMGSASALPAKVIGITDDDLAIEAEVEGESDAPDVVISQRLNDWQPLGMALDYSREELDLRSWIELLESVRSTIESHNGKSQSQNGTVETQNGTVESQNGTDSYYNKRIIKEERDPSRKKSQFSDPNELANKIRQRREHGFC